MRLLPLSLLLLSLSSQAQSSLENALTIALSLNRPETQWIFNHVCVPEQSLEGFGFTRGDFVDAFIIVSKTRWELSMGELERGNEKESMKPLALIIHGVIDAYWPGRLDRDSEGAIVAFKTCEQLDGLQGMLKEERSGNGPNAATKEVVTKTISEVIRKWKDRRPFEEVATLLRAGPLRLNSTAALLPLVAK